MLLLDASTFCSDTQPIWAFVGTIVKIFKIVIPILLIIFGSIDLGKAVVASDDKAIKSAATTLGKRAIAAVVIFFIPTIVGAIFNLFAGGKDSMKEASVCVNCVTKGC
jgi:fumarate reductase subunit D